MPRIWSVEIWTLGQAEAQFGVVHRWADRYDIEVDTSVLTPDEAVARIAAALDVSSTTRVVR